MTDNNKQYMSKYTKSIYVQYLHNSNNVELRHNLNSNCALHTDKVNTDYDKGGKNKNDKLTELEKCDKLVYEYKIPNTNLIVTKEIPKLTSMDMDLLQWVERFRLMCKNCEWDSITCHNVFRNIVC